VNLHKDLLYILHKIVHYNIVAQLMQLLITQYVDVIALVLLNIIPSLLLIYGFVFFKLHAQLPQVMSVHSLDLQKELVNVIMDIFHLLIHHSLWFVLALQDGLYKHQDLLMLVVLLMQLLMLNSIVNVILDTSWLEKTTLCL